MFVVVRGRSVVVNGSGRRRRRRLRVDGSAQAQGGQRLVQAVQRAHDLVLVVVVVREIDGFAADRFVVADHAGRDANRSQHAEAVARAARVAGHSLDRRFRRTTRRQLDRGRHHRFGRVPVDRAVAIRSRHPRSDGPALLQAMKAALPEGRLTPPFLFKRRLRSARLEEPLPSQGLLLQPTKELGRRWRRWGRRRSRPGRLHDTFPCLELHAGAEAVRDAPDRGTIREQRPTRRSSAPGSSGSGRP